MVYERVADYWGGDILVNRGRNNFDELRYEYYRDGNVALEAFRAGNIGMRFENSSRLWATAYTGPGIDRGWIVKEEIVTEGGTGMQGFVFNTGREIFRDPRVRAAMGYAFESESTDANPFYGAFDPALDQSRSRLTWGLLRAGAVPA